LAERIVRQIITTHRNTDFDALASVVAAKLLYPEAIEILPRTLNPNVKAFLSIHKDLFPIHRVDDIDLMRVSRLIVVDANSWERLDRMDPLKHNTRLEIIVWDHHIDPGSISGNQQFVQQTGATTSLLVEQLKQQQKILTPIQATLFLAGIYEDTGNLTFPSTTAEDAYAAAYLLERKADLDVLNTFLRPAYGQMQKNILFKMLQTAKRIKINDRRISINKVDVRGHVDNLAVVVRMYLDIVNVDAAFGVFLDRERGTCMVIGRSNVDSFDVGAIMRSMGGGGHPRAAAAMLKSVNPDAVESWIQELIRGNQQTSVQVGDLMSFPVVSVLPDCSLQEAARILREKGCTGLPVVENGQLVGIISRRDFRRVRKESQMWAPVKAFMTRQAITIHPGKSPMQAAQLMVKHDIGRLPVVKDGQIIGIVTRSDVMLYFYDLLPD
jgi:tRNA nucleotidyltransferase (CCA-adding enzyme)